MFGQLRQDELLAYLLERVESEILKKMNKLLRIDLSPPGREIRDSDVKGL